MKPTTDKKMFAIGLLSLTAAALLVGNYFAPRSAIATTTIKDRDFSMTTASVSTGGDSLYVLDNRSGRVAVYSYDPSTKVIRPRAAGEMSTLFSR
jgi:hypothetical protein